MLIPSNIYQQYGIHASKALNSGEDIFVFLLKAMHLFYNI